MTLCDGLNQASALGQVSLGLSCTFLSAFSTDSPGRQGLLFQCLESISEHTQSNSSLLPFPQASLQEVLGTA